MAKENDRKLTDLDKKTSLLIYGSNDELQAENNDLHDIVKSTVFSTREKFGERAANGGVINYFNEINYNTMFNGILNDKKDKESVRKMPTDKTSFKRMMSDDFGDSVNSMLLSDLDRSAKFENFKSIYRHIPECAQALETYKDNILSPDDFTKLIFNFNINGVGEETETSIRTRLDDIREKYKLEELTDEIVGNSLMLGEQYVTCLSLDDELSYILDNMNSFERGNSKSLNESFSALDESVVNAKLDSKDFQLTEVEINAFKAIGFDTSDPSKKVMRGKKTLNESEMSIESIEANIANILNENIQFGSKKELLKERFEYEAQLRMDNKNLTDIPGTEVGENKNRKEKKKDSKPLGITGSSVKILDPEKVVELKIDNICYGYYYIEDAGNQVSKAGYLGTEKNRNASSNLQLAGNNTLASSTTTIYSPGQGSPSDQLNVDETKLRLISDVFISGIAKKVDKDFIRHNRELKDFIFHLIKQDYIIKKAVKITYFYPEDIVKFEVPAIYRKILFMAKLYLSVLTNNLLIKLGRSHDKRVFYINTGLDADYEQAISKVIQDIKTKEYKMDNLNDINTILNLNPGRFDDYYIPTVSGERPIEIETLAGMDAELDNEFLNFLKSSILSGIGVPKSLIDALQEVDFARTLSAQNSVFLRSVIRYQKLLTPSFQKFIERLYKNEFLYDSNGQTRIDVESEIDAIEINFPSPASLNFTNIADQIQTVDGNAEFIATQLLPIGMNEDNSEEKAKLKAKIVEDMLPNIEWDKYREILDEMRKDTPKDDLEKALRSKPVKEDPMNDPYGGAGY